MGSVGLVWKGSCVAAQQDELLGFVQRLAEENDRFLQLYPPPEDEYRHLAQLDSERVAALRSRRNVEVLNRSIAETVEIDSSIFALPGQLEAGAEEIGLPILRVERPPAIEGPFVVNFDAPVERKFVRIKRVSVYGVDFKLFAAGYPWYPGENRASFVFLHCPEHLFLDGRIVAVYHRTLSPGLIRFNPIDGAEWYVTAPELHLNEYLYLSWFNYFFSWVKFFIVPDLYWWSYTDLPSYPDYRREFVDLERQVGTALAKQAVFDDVLSVFRNEAELRATVRRKRQRVRRPEPGLQGRVLRALRDAGEIK